LRFGGGRWDSGNGRYNDGRWEGGSQDVLKGNVLSKIVSKVLVDKGVLGRHREKVLFLIFMVLTFVEGDMGEGAEIIGDDRGLGSAGDDVGGAVGNVEEGEILDVVKGGPDRSGGWGILEFRGLRDNRLEDMGSDIERTWVIPSIIRALKDLKDGSGGICNILLVNVIKGRPGGNRDMGEGRRGDSSGLRSVERHLILQLAPL